MSLFSGLGNFVTNLVGGLVSSATGGLTNVLTSTIAAATPMVSTAVNSTAAQIAAGGYSGNSETAASIAAANGVYNGSGSHTTMGTNGKIVQLNKLSGLAKFFCYYNMDSEGRIELDNGQPKLNISKVIVHASVVGVLIFGIVKVGKKKRWF